MRAALTLSLLLTFCSAQPQPAVDVNSSEFGLQCDGSQFAGDLRTALLSRDEAAVTQFSCSFLRGAASMPPGLLNDERELPIGEIVRVPTAVHYYQFGPARIADFAMCLLEVKYEVTTRDIVAKTAPSLLPLCGNGCEVCTSQTVGTDSRIRDAVRQYWSEHP
jgi:hypothetical protein